MDVAPNNEWFVMNYTFFSGDHFISPFLNIETLFEPSDRSTNPHVDIKSCFFAAIQVTKLSKKELEKIRDRIRFMDYVKFTLNHSNAAVRVIRILLM